MPDQPVYPTEEPHDQQVVNALKEDIWQIFVHNDDQTPFEYVIYTLSSVFMLSEEIAEHIASTAHSQGTAVVVARPRAEAEKLMRIALGRAKTDGYPLQFTLEQA
jgi:ATP-dependent Clp protease adaptor protein ClpS